MEEAPTRQEGPTRSVESGLEGIGQEVTTELFNDEPRGERHIPRGGTPRA
jgi:hypothetical protein